MNYHELVKLKLDLTEEQEQRARDNVECLLDIAHKRIRERGEDPGVTNVLAQLTVDFGKLIAMYRLDGNDVNLRTAQQIYLQFVWEHSDGTQQDFEHLLKFADNLQTLNRNADKAANKTSRKISDMALVELIGKHGWSATAIAGETGVALRTVQSQIKSFRGKIAEIKRMFPESD